jgi:hypothetical protein
MKEKKVSKIKYVFIIEIGNGGSKQCVAVENQ